MRFLEIVNNNNFEKFYVKSLSNDQEIMQYINSTVISEMRYCGVPISAENHITRLSSAIFEGIHSVVNAGKSFLKTFNQLDQHRFLKIAVGQKVAILNIVMSGNFVELFGFKNLKTITKIRRDLHDRIVQIEFNNNENDVWPRNKLASFNGNLLMTSAFFKSSKDVDQALTMLALSKPEELQMRVSLQESFK